MEKVLKVISAIISILIILLPLLIFIFHFFYQTQFVMFVNNKNTEEIIQMLNADGFTISNNEDIDKIELKKIMLSRYSELKVINKNKEFDEFAIKPESSDYQIIKYMSENAININKIINIINLIVLFLVIFFTIYCFKIK